MVPERSPVFVSLLALVCAMALFSAAAGSQDNGDDDHDRYYYDDHDDDEDDGVVLCQLERHKKWRDWEYAGYFRLCSTPREEGGNPHARVCRWTPIVVAPDEVPRHLDVDSVLPEFEEWEGRVGNRAEVGLGCNTVRFAVGGGPIGRLLFAARQRLAVRRAYKEAPSPQALLTVYYGTSRSPRRDDMGEVVDYEDTLPSHSGQEDFGRATRLRLGKAEVSIPPGHLPGELESPSVWSFEFEADPQEHVVVQSVQELESREALVAELRSRIESADSAAFVFVHGYNVTFMDGLRRAAQLYCDLGACDAARRFNPPAPILFSWPSGGGLGDYTAAEEGARASHQALEDFLTLVRDETGATTVHLIAHSMGNRVLAQALDGLAESGGSERSRFNQIVLAAPDITRTELANVAEEIAAMGSRVTLYASSEDLALRVSRAVHRVGDRAGFIERGASPFVLRSEQTGETLFDAVDATKVKMGEFLGHSYVFRASLLPDLTALFKGGAGPDGKCRSRWYQRQGDYWVLLKPTRRQLAPCQD